ncbi:inositol-trisphosphate 3-kinase A-like [Rhinophrynus dorsalis]
MIPKEVPIHNGMNHLGDPGESPPSPNESSGRKRLSVGELRLYFEARCEEARNGQKEPRRRRRMGSGSWHRSNGEVLDEPRTGSWDPHVIPQLMVTSSEEPSPPPPSPSAVLLDLPGWDGMRGEGLLKLATRRLSVSTTSLSSTGSSSVVEDSEDDLLSDSENKSQGNVDLEQSEEHSLAA